MKRILLSVLFIVFCLTAFVGCMKWDYGEMEDFSATGDGLFITNEGTFSMVMLPYLIMTRKRKR